MTPITDKLAETVKKAREDVNWMLNSGQLLNPFVFDYLDDALAAYASQQAEPSEARVEAAAKVLSSFTDYWPHMADSLRDVFRERARAVLQAADAVSAGVPDGYVLVPEKATPLIREALRIGMRREVPNDELCDIRWRAAIAAAQDSEKKESGS